MGTEYIGWVLPTASEYDSYTVKPTKDSPVEPDVMCFDDEDDEVHSPDHYELFPEFGIEVIDLIEVQCSKLDRSDLMKSSAFAGRLYGDVIKYSMRFMDKGGVQDLKKCQVYLQMLIDHLEHSDEIQSSGLGEEGNNP